MLFLVRDEIGYEFWSFDEQAGLQARTRFDGKAAFKGVVVGLYYMVHNGVLRAIHPDGSEAFHMDLGVSEVSVDEFAGKVLVQVGDDRSSTDHTELFLLEDGKIVATRNVNGSLTMFGERMFLSTRTDKWEIESDLSGIHHIRQGRDTLYAMWGEYLYHSGTDELHGEEVWRTKINYTKKGDVNLDGTVDFEDFLALSANFGQSRRNMEYSAGDLDANGRVDFADFLLMAANFEELGASVD